MKRKKIKEEDEKVKEERGRHGGTRCKKDPRKGDMGLDPLSAPDPNAPLMRCLNALRRPNRVTSPS